LQTLLQWPSRGGGAPGPDRIARFGNYAASEAAARAERSRDVGNVEHFCRWRQIERMILILAAGSAAQTIH